MQENARRLYAAVLLHANDSHELLLQALASEISSLDMTSAQVASFCGEIWRDVGLLLNEGEIWPELIPGPVNREADWDALVEHVHALATDGAPKTDPGGDEYLYRIWFWQDDETPMGKSISVEETSWMNFVDDLIQIPGWELAEIVSGKATRLITRRTAETIQAMNRAQHLFLLATGEADLLDDSVFQSFEDTAANDGAKWRLSHPLDPHND